MFSFAFSSLYRVGHRPVGKKLNNYEVYISGIMFLLFSVQPILSYYLIPHNFVSCKKFPYMGSDWGEWSAAVWSGRLDREGSGCPVSSYLFPFATNINNFKWLAHWSAPCFSFSPFWSVRQTFRPPMIPVLDWSKNPNPCTSPLPLRLLLAFY